MTRARYFAPAVLVLTCMFTPALGQGQEAPGLDQAMRHFANNVAAYRAQGPPRHAKAGEVFTEDVGRAFRDRITRLVHQGGIRPSDLRNEIDDETAAAAEKRLVVNGHFEWRYGSSMPPEVLDVLPPLPRGLEYRFVRHSLVLVDIDADLVVDILHDAVPRH